MSSEEDGCPRFRSLIQGLAARQMFLEKGAITSYDFYKCYSKYRPRFKPSDAARLFYLLRRLELIVEVGVEKSSRGGFDRHLYAIVPGKENDPAWVNPAFAVYGERYKPRR